MKSENNIVGVSEDIIRRLFKSISEPSGGIGYRVDHSLRVKKYLETFLSNLEIISYNFDEEIVISAGILHDIGDLARVKNSIIDYSIDIDHAKIGSKYAQEELFNYGFEHERILKICKIIENHHNYNISTSAETKLVQDADQIDEVGVLNVWQIFGYSINKQRSLGGTLAYWSDEGRARKLKCIEQCNFNFTKQYARDRFNKLDEFMIEIIQEVSGNDFNM